MAVIAASRGSALAFERSFINWEEGIGICHWDAPSRQELEELFNQAGTPFEKMVEVEEYLADSLT